MLKRLILKFLVVLLNEMESNVLRRIMSSWYGVDIGLYSYGCFDPSRIPRGTKVGRYCSLSASSSFFPRNHGVEFLSLHPYLYNSSLDVVDTDMIERTLFVVEEDVWIGHNATITSKAKKIGRGSIIAANSVVTDDVPRYAVVAGVPARVIRFRFSRDTIDQIERSEWWKMNKRQLRNEIASNPDKIFKPEEYYDSNH